MHLFSFVLESDYFVSGSDIYRLYAGKIDHVNVPIELIEHYTHSYPSLKTDWLSFDEIMRDEARKSRKFSIYNKTIKTCENLSQHPTEKILDVLQQTFPSEETVNDSYKYQPDQLLNAEVKSIIQIDNKNQLSSVQSINKNYKYYILLDRTNFYSASGGQSSDHGTIQFFNKLNFNIE